MEAENLFYQCCERIGDNYDAAESYLVGCIYYLMKKQDKEDSRVAIAGHLKVYNFERYIRQLRFIATLREDSFRALVLSSLDASKMEAEVKILDDFTKDVDYALVEGTTHTGKIGRIIKSLTNIHERMKPKKHITTDSSKGG